MTSAVLHTMVWGGARCTTGPDHSLRPQISSDRIELARFKVAVEKLATSTSTPKVVIRPIDSQCGRIECTEPLN